MLAVALTAAAWLPWRTTQQHYSSDYPPYGVPYGPVSALQPDDHGILSEEEERQKNKEKRQKCVIFGAGGLHVATGSSRQKKKYMKCVLMNYPESGAISSYRL